MPVYDLSGVTRTLINLIQNTVNASPGYPVLPFPRLRVVPQPPDRLQGDAIACFYLYHVTEDPQLKNLEGPPGSPEVKFTPMPLQLHYVLSAHWDDNESAQFNEQLAMGLSMKALRDTPFVDANTMAGGVPVFDPRMGSDDRVRLYLNPVPAAEAVSYWTAGQSPLRLAAYYQVTIALLEPEEYSTRSARVLSYGVFALIGGRPRLDTTSSEISFTPPGGAAQTVRAQPAQVAQGDELSLHGSGFAAGPAVLLVRAAAAGSFSVADVAWNLQVKGDGLATALVQPAASGTPITPGIYSAELRVSTLLKQRDGSQRAVTSNSNQTPFTVTPAVSAVSAIDATGAFTITGTGYTPTAAVSVFLGGDALAPGAPALNPGQFSVTSATQIAARLPAGSPSGTAVALRIVVSGAESAPFWVIPP
jgi:hypothetical protein